MKSRQKNAGFTLVEMALVLVVIGLILGAVSIGKDMQRNAEYKKLKQKFVDQWIQAYNEHYDRLGYLPGDTPAYPTMTVNGKEHDDYDDLKSDPASVEDDGEALCNDAANSSTALTSAFAQAGIEVPPGRGTGAEDKYLYLDSNGNPQQVRVCFQWLAPGNGAGAGNVMVMHGLTPDLAKFIDNLVDGQVEGGAGRFRLMDSNATTGTGNWPTGNNVSGTTNLKDVDQIPVITAALRMNQ